MDLSLPVDSSKKVNPWPWLISSAFAIVWALVMLLSMQVSVKWFAMSALGLVSIFAAAFFRNAGLFLVSLLAACIPVAIQYNPAKGSNKFMTVLHHGGAQADPVLFLSDFPLVLLTLLWLVEIATGKRKPPIFDAIDKSIWLFLLFSAFSIYATEELTLTLMELVRYLKYYMLFVVLRSYFSDPRNVIASLAVSLLMIIPNAMVALAQYFIFFSLPIPVGGVSSADFELVDNIIIQRVTGLIGHCNTFGSYLLLPLVILMVTFFSKAPWWSKLSHPILMILACLSLVFTFSRNSWLMLVMLMGLTAILFLRKKRLPWFYVLGLAGAGFVTLGLLIVSGAMEIILVRVLDDNGKAYDSRWDLIAVALEMFKSSPLVGIGLNTFEDVMSFHDKTGVTNIIQQPVHNIYLLVMAETGIIALFFFVQIGWRIMMQGWRLMKSNREIEFIVGTIVFFVFLQFGFSNMFDLTLRKEPILALTTMIAAMIAVKENACITLKEKV